MFKVIVKEKSYRDQLSQKIVMFPDGQRRMLSLSQWYWDTIEDVHVSGWPFFELLEAAMTLAIEFPSGQGFEVDIHHETKRMIKTAYHGLCDERMRRRNDNAI